MPLIKKNIDNPFPSECEIAVNRIEKVFVFKPRLKKFIVLFRGVFQTIYMCDF